MSMPPEGPYQPDNRYGQQPQFGPGQQFGAGQQYGAGQQFGAGQQPGFTPPRRRKKGPIIGAVVAVVAVAAGIVAAVVLTRGDDESTSTSAISAQSSTTDEATPAETIGRTRLDRTPPSVPRTSRSGSQTSRESTSRTAPAGPDELEIEQVTERVLESTTADALAYYCSRFVPTPNAQEVIYDVVSVDDIQISGDNATANVTVDDHGETLAATLSYVKEGGNWKYCPAS